MESLDIVSIDIFNLKGKDLLKEAFTYIYNMHSDELQGYCIILDANSNRSSKVDKITNIFNEYNLPVPEDEGELVEDEGIFTSYQLIPTHQENGILEDMLIKSVENTPNIYCVEEMYECLQTYIENPRFSNKSKSKAKAYLSTKEDNIPHVGIAAQKNYWNFDNKVFNPLKD